MTRTLALAALLVLTGCQTVTEERREPARVRIIDIDTRPIPQASTIDGVYIPRQSTPPIYRAIAAAVIAQPPKPQPITVDPDGRIALPPDFRGRVTLSEAEGDRPEIRPPTGGGAKSKALAWVSRTTKVPQRGAWFMVIGAALLVAAPVAWWLKASLRLVGILAIAGASLIGIGYLIDTVPWIFAVAFLAGGVYVAWSIWESRQKGDNATTLEVVTPVIEDLPRIVLAELTKAMPEANGETLADVSESVAVKVKTAIGGKAKANPKVADRVERAVTRAKKVTKTATAYRGK